MLTLDSVQVSDLPWIGKDEYDSESGSGSLAVEFAGTAVSSSGFGGTIQSAEEEARSYATNPELHWNEGYYRGYYELYVSHESVEAKFFGENNYIHPRLTVQLLTAE